MSNFYINPLATGAESGLDWTNAYTSIPATLQRGDVYYLADGVYDSYTCNDAVSGSLTITLKKATALDHGSSVGWEASFGDGQAVFEQITITTDYWVIDGAGRTGWSSGHGIGVARTTSSSRAIITTGADNITLKYVEVEYLGITDLRDDGLYASAGCNNYLIQYCYFHDINSNGILIHGTNNLVEHTLFARIQSQVGSAIHGQAIQMFYNGTQNMEIRYCRFEDIGGTASIAMAWGTDGVAIHGNVFYYTDGFSGAGTSPGQIVEISDPDEIGVSNLQIYNNTFYNQHDGNPGINIYIQASNTNYVYNNVWSNCSRPASVRGMTEHTHNSFYDTSLAYGSTADPTEEFLTGDPFTDSANYDLSLSGATTAGKAIDSGVSYDILGHERGLDGILDRGAYEYLSIPAPADLAATQDGATALSLSWIDASSDEDGFIVERSLDGTTGWTEIADLPAGSTAYVDTGLSSGTAYYYRVAAYNEYGSSAWSDIASAATGAVQALISGSQIGSNSMLLWN